MEGVLPMLGLLIISLVLAVQSLPIADALASVLQESSTDLAGSAETKTTGEHLTNHYLPDTATYSVNNAAYDLGQDNAGISWDSPLNEASIIYENIEDAWQDESNEIFADQVSKSSDCVVQNDFQLELYPDTNRSELFNESVENVNLSMSSDNPENRVSVNCGSSRDMVYRQGDYEKNLSGFNRYSELGNFTADFYTTVESEFDSVSLDNSYSGSGEACGSTSTARSRARSDAQSSYEDDTPSASSIASTIDKASDIAFDIGQSDDANVIDSNPGEGSCCRTTCTSRDENGSCTSRTCVANTKTDEVTISPSSSDVNLAVEDMRSELPIDGLYRRLAIEVDEYTYNH